MPLATENSARSARPVTNSAPPRRSASGGASSVHLSEAAQTYLRERASAKVDGAGADTHVQQSESPTSSPDQIPTDNQLSTDNQHPTDNELSPDEQQQVEQLERRDAEVRAHEQAHQAAAGGLANGGPQFEFQTGPDGRRYAIGGHVSIDTTAIAGDPAATVAKAATIQRAALAPVDPSATDRSVAAKAGKLARQAQQELAINAREQTTSETDTDTGTGRDDALTVAPHRAVAAYRNQSSAQAHVVFRRAS